MQRLTAVQEEDFVTNLYNRHLLSRFSEAEMQKLLNEAVAWVDDFKDITDENVKTALVCRLNFRKSFLAAVAFEDATEDVDSHSAWQQCDELLCLLLETKTVGVAVKDAFSTKIQRRLASTVPPRPIVQITFEDAYAHLSRLCQDGKEVHGVLDYHGGNNLLVHHPSNFSIIIIIIANHTIQ